MIYFMLIFAVIVYPIYASYRLHEFRIITDEIDDKRAWIFSTLTLLIDIIGIPAGLIFLTIDSLS